MATFEDKTWNSSSAILNLILRIQFALSSSGEMSSTRWVFCGRLLFEISGVVRFRRHGI